MARPWGLLLQRRRRLLLLLAAAACLAPASAIFEDQAGTYDWYKQFVGRPRDVAFLPGREQLYLASHQNLLASLGAASGGVAWRRKYTQHDALDALVLVPKPPLVAAASNGGKYVRGWDAADGGFRWEALVFEGPPAAAAAAAGGSAVGLAAVERSGQAAVAVAAGGTVKLLSASKGDTLWSADLEAAAAGAAKHLLTQAGSITVAAYTPGSGDVSLLQLDLADGSHQDSEQLAAPGGVALGSTAAVSGPALAVLSEDGQQLCTLLLPGSSGLSCVALSGLAAGLAAAPAGGLRLAPSGAGSFLLSAGPGRVSKQGLGAHTAQGVAVVAVSDAGPSLSSWHAGASAGAASSDAAGAAALLLASASGSSLSLQLLDPAGGQQLDAAELQLPAPAYPHSGPAPTLVGAWLDASRHLKAAAAGTSSRRGLKGCQALLLWSDDALTFVSNASVSWAREEALSSGTASLAVELPAARAAAAQGGGTGGLWGLLGDRSRLERWVRLQVLGVLVQFRLNTDAEREEFLGLRQALSDNNLPFRDTNGFRKLLVVLTAPGKVFGLHSGDGRILWTSSTPMPTAAAASQQPCSAPQLALETRRPRLLLREWRRFHDLTHAPQLAVLAAGCASGALHVLNGHTGEEMQHTELPHGVDKVVPLPRAVHDGAADQLALLLVEAPPSGEAPGADGTASARALPRVRLLPDTPATRAQLAASSASLFFWLATTDGSSSSNAVSNGETAGETAGGAGGGGARVVLRGYGLPGGAAPDGSGGLLPVLLAWQVVLPGRLLALAAKDPSEPLHSYVKVLGDRSLKYKYVNPNLLLVATAAERTADEQTVSVALLNTVTGGVLHQQLHRGAAGPVHAVASEHWVVYSHWDVTSLRTQVTVIELYDASPRDLSIEAVLLGRTRHSATLSAYSEPQLEVASQAFYLQHAVQSMAVSQTRQGITTKQLLLGTVTDQVYALDKRYLDPRRPMTAKVTPEQAEERLVPYSELLIFSSLQYASQDKQILNLRSVSAWPAVLESTTLLLAQGTDLFFTRITPAAHFDSLPPDFSYGLLVVALLGLAGGTWFAAYSSRQALLKAKWQ